MENPRLLITGITRAEAAELQGIENAQLVKLEKVAGVDSSRFGDVATLIAITTLSALSLQVLALWLAKSRSDDSVTLTTETEHPSGKRERRTVTLKTSKSEPPDKSFLKQLGEIFKVDVSSLLKAKK
jgi:hypothetical protein